MNGIAYSLGGNIFTTYYISLSIFLAYAVTYPDLQLLLMFVIPIKMKWMAGGSSLRRLWLLPEQGPVRMESPSINVRSADVPKRMTQTWSFVSAQSATEIMNIVRIIYLHINTYSKTHKRRRTLL